LRRSWNKVSTGSEGAPILGSILHQSLMGYLLPSQPFRIYPRTLKLCGLGVILAKTPVGQRLNTMSTQTFIAGFWLSTTTSQFTKIFAVLGAAVSRAGFERQRPPLRRKRYVEQRGFEIDSAFQGKEGLKWCASRGRRRPYPWRSWTADAPRWDGIETVARILAGISDLQL